MGGGEEGLTEKDEMFIKISKKRGERDIRNIERENA